jgi:2-dehydropantoate 2-reductase
MRVAVVGAGGVGGMLGALLARAGKDVTLIARGANLKTLRADGLTLKTLDDGDVHLEVRATDDPREVGPVDLVWFCVKTYDVEAAARQAAPLVGPGTLILTPQNGVEAADQVAAVLGGDHVLGCAAVAGGTLVAPGLVAQKLRRQHIKLGELSGGASRRADELRDFLRDGFLRGGIETEVSSDIRREIWEKLVVTCVTLGLVSLTRLPVSWLYSRPRSAALVRGVMEEAAAVARSKGVALPRTRADELFEWLRKLAESNPFARGSMYFDLIEGRRLELEAINGAVSRMGRELGVPTPLNDVVYAALEPYADGASARPAQA